MLHLNTVLPGGKISIKKFVARSEKCHPCTRFQTETTLSNSGAIAARLGLRNPPKVERLYQWRYMPFYLLFEEV